MNKLTVIANIEINLNMAHDVKAALKKLVHATRKEEGCLSYDLHVNVENPAHFMLYEIWESRELWVQHKKAQHLKDFELATASAVVKANVQEMKRIV